MHAVLARPRNKLSAVATWFKKLGRALPSSVRFLTLYVENVDRKALDALMAEVGELTVLRLIFMSPAEYVVACCV